MTDFSDAAFAKEFSAGLVKIMEEAIARAVLPLRNRIKQLEERQQEHEQQLSATPKSKILRAI